MNITLESKLNDMQSDGKDFVDSVDHLNKNQERKLSDFLDSCQSFSSTLYEILFRDYDHLGNRVKGVEKELKEKVESLHAFFEEIRTDIAVNKQSYDDLKHDSGFITEGGFSGMMNKWIKDTWWVWAIIFFLGGSIFTLGVANINGNTDSIKSSLSKELEPLKVVINTLRTHDKDILELKANDKQIKNDIEHIKETQEREFNNLKSLYKNGAIENYAGSEE